MMVKKLLSTAFFLVPAVLFAQVTDSLPPEEEEDFSQYENMTTIDDGKKVKLYCTSKVFDQTPNRLIGIGYEFQGPYTIGSLLNPTAAVPQNEEAEVNFSHGLRLETNIPVISKTNVLWSIGGGYTDHYYAVKGNQEDNHMARTLAEGSIRNLYLNTTVFKPFDQKNFLLAQMQGDYAGDWNFANWQNPKYIKVSGVAIYGRKVHDRFMWGVGLTRTYRAGEVNYLPVVLLNYTSVSRKWGIEMLAPARADFRYNFSTRNLLRAGVELEGTSYRLNDRKGYFATAYQTQELRDLELRRSEIKARVVWDFPLKDFYWASLAVGYPIMYNYNVDNGEFFRGFFGDQVYIVENNVASALFISLSFNLVSP
jgi:hypothetical protein